MMTKFILIKVNGIRLTCGSILKLEDKKITDMDSKINIKSLDVIEDMNREEISESNVKFLFSKNIEDRVKIHNSGLFKRIECLQPDDECIIISKKNRSRDICIFSRRTENHISVKQNGQDKSMLISDIESVVIVQYYICVTKYANTEVGTIIANVDGEKKTYPDGRYCGIDSDKLEKISRAEAVFMGRCPRECRLEMHVDKLWESIDKLGVGERCSLKMEMGGGSFRIIAKDKREDSVKYSLESRDKKRSFHSVDAWNIRPWMSERETGGTRTGMEGARKDSTNLMERGKVDDNVTVRGRQARPNIPAIIRCDKNNLDIVNHRNIQSLDKGDSYDKLVLLKQGSNTTSAVTLKWKGKVNGEMCLGCELSKDCKYGTDGTFNDRTLFECAMERGVLIVVDRNMECCEIDGRKHADIKIGDDGFIEEKCICCAERRVSLSGDSRLSIGNKIVLKNDKEGTIKWTGKINGEDCVGVEMDNYIYRGTDGTFKGMKIFDSYNNYAVIVRLTDIPAIIWCDKNKLDIVNHTNIQSLDKGDSYDKLVLLKQGSNTTSAVTLKWKGKVNGKICLGCELSKDCKYGTVGTFNDRKLFDCAMERGVLIVVDGNMECCEIDGKNHDDIKIGNDGFIEEKCICCAERREPLSADGRFCIGDKIVLKDDKEGKIKWMGKINREDCVGLEMDKYCRGTNGTFNGMKIFDSYTKYAVIVRLTDIPTSTKCDQLDLDVLDPTTIKSTRTLKEVSIHVVLKRNTKSVTVEVKWMGQVDGRDCIGCVLPSTFKYGTDGTFCGQALFKCEDKRGVLIDKEKFPSCVSFSDGRGVTTNHKNVVMSESKWIKEWSICCMQSVDKLTKCPQIKINNAVAVKDYKEKGTCLWLGLINGTETVGLSLSGTKTDGCDGTFCGTSLFKCEKYSGVLCQAEYVRLVPNAEWTKDKFLKNDFDLSDADRGQCGDWTDKLVSVINNPIIYGRVRFGMTLLNEALLGVRVNKYFWEKNHKIFKDALFRDDADNEECVIVVAESRANIFDEKLRFRENGVIINEVFVRVRESNTTSDIKKDDIVTYTSWNETSHGRVEISELLNGIPCVRVVNSICLDKDEEVRYIREVDVNKIHVDSSTTKYLEDTVIDPASIVTFDVLKDDEDARVNDEVEFKLRCSRSKFEGKVIMVVKVNKSVPSVVIALTAEYDKVDLSKYKINEMTSFKKVISDTKSTVVIIPVNVVRPLSKKIIFCDKNKVSVLDPLRVSNVTRQNMDDRVIIFKSERETVVARCKWTGRVNDDVYMGCEMKKESVYGTDGKFGSDRLFDCADRRGVLIGLNSVSECCVNGSHNKLQIWSDGRVMGSSVCCARTIEAVGDKSEIKLGRRVMRMNDGDDGRISGICRWMGFVNEEEVIGVDMVQRGDAGEDRLLDDLALFDCLSNKRGLFKLRGFVNDVVGLSYCAKNGVFVVDPANITSMDNGGTLQKKMMHRIDRKELFLDIRWRGVVNGVLCVGSELNNVSEYGCDGVFMGNRLFECGPGRGVLIPVDELKGTCEYGHHIIVDKQKKEPINTNSICCVQTVNTIKKWPQMKIGSKIIFKKAWYNWGNKTGKCKWMGLMNGQESVGVVMKDDIANGTDGTFSFVELFKCKNGRGVLFTSEDIVHDVNGEKLHFVVDKFVDVTKIWNIKDVNGMDGMKVGDCVSVNVGLARGRNTGELKWMGYINDEKCVGIDLEEESVCGMDGVINDRHRFVCLPRHGVVTTMDNVVPVLPLRLSFTENDVVNADKYLRCEEKWDGEYSMKKNICKNGKVSVSIGQIKMKGTLRWCGTMNGECVMVVELDKDFVDGTDGRFWRENLINCRDKRAVAVPRDKVCEYIPYKTMSIPLKDRLFEPLDVNSAVIYYVPRDGILVNMYGTVRWSGMDENDVYIYGIELDDKYKDGTDGEFDGHRLFQCQYGHGVLAPIDKVAPDTRFSEMKVNDEDIKKSVINTVARLAIPVIPQNGENYGIQGNANSCYFDSSIFALFSKSDVLDFMFSEKINEKEENKITKRFREVMAWSIVYPLREHGFVSFHHTQTLRDVIKDYGGKFTEMTKQESDMENVASLLSKLCPENQLLSLKSFSGHKNSGMFLQLFVILNKAVVNISSQQMLEVSMAQNDIMFDEPPTCLIMQAPRDAKGINCYQNVLPSNTIEISNLCSPCFKKCHKCASKATYQCKKCIERTLSVKDGLLCDRHKCHHDDVLKFPESKISSKSQIQMQLKAIICIEKAHFVAYVKEDEFKSNWVFFDSMSTQNIANNYAVPKVSFEKEVSDFLNQDEREMERMVNMYGNDNLKRVVKDSYIFVYHNTTKTCY